MKVGDVVDEDLTDPRDPFRLGRSAELMKTLMGLEERFLDDVRSVGFSSHLAMEAGRREDPKVVTVCVEQLAQDVCPAFARKSDVPRNRRRGTVHTSDVLLSSC